MVTHRYCHYSPTTHAGQYQHQSDASNVQAESLQWNPCSLPAPWLGVKERLQVKPGQVHRGSKILSSHWHFLLFEVVNTKDKEEFWALADTAHSLRKTCSI